MAYWILKTEPTADSFDTLQRDGRTSWDGVANVQALNNIHRMRPGDEALIYHSGDLCSTSVHHWNVTLAMLVTVGPNLSPSRHDHAPMLVLLAYASSMLFYQQRIVRGDDPLIAHLGDTTAL